jgi:hypothetical protein
MPCTKIGDPAQSFWKNHPAMKSFLSTLVLLTATLLASPAAAQIAGSWQVSGKIGSTAFVTNCQFLPDDAGFGGACTETPSGKRHVLTKASVTGNQVQWSYPASFMLMKFEVVFSGTLNSTSITGTVTAHGHNGIFTATRNPAAP